MMRQRIILERTSIILMAVGASLCGCAGDGGSPYSGRAILAELERSNIPLAGDDGRAVPPAQPAADELPETGPIKLVDLLRVAQARNPDLAAARSQVGVSAGQVWQASLYPNPTVELSSQEIPFNGGIAESKTTIGLTQPIILGARRRAAVSAADAQRAARLAEVEQRRRAVFGEIATVYARVVSIHEQERLHVELRELTGRTLTAAQTRFEARAAPETDVLRPQVQLYQLDAAIARLSQDRAAAVRQLGLLLGGVTIDADRLADESTDSPPPLDLAALQSALRANHPALVVADREIDSAAARLDQVKAERVPDLDARVAVGYRGDSDEGIYEIGAGMTIPLWDAREGDVLSLRFELMRARQQRLAVENDLLRELAGTCGEYESARAPLETLRDKVVPAAQRAFDQTGEGYRAGRASFIDLLDSQRTLIETRVTLAELKGVVAAARARLTQLAGPENTPAPVALSPWDSNQRLNQSLQQRPKGAEVNP